MELRFYKQRFFAFLTNNRFLSIVAVLLVGLLFWWWRGLFAAEAVLLGGASWLVPSFITSFMWRKMANPFKPLQVVMILYFGSFIKIIVSITLLIIWMLALSMSFLPLIAGYIVAILVINFYWIRMIARGSRFF